MGNLFYIKWLLAYGIFVLTGVQGRDWDYIENWRDLEAKYAYYWWEMN